MTGSLFVVDDKWLGVKVASEQQRKLLEDIVADLRTYKDAGVHLQKWIAQKEKMVAVLGPVATEPSMIKNQLEQVKVFHIIFVSSFKDLGLLIININLCFVCHLLFATSNSESVFAPKFCNFISRNLFSFF